MQQKQYDKILKQARSYLVPPTWHARTLAEYVRSLNNGRQDLWPPENITFEETVWLGIYAQGWRAGLKLGGSLAKAKR
jgi:hypothetical protein